MTTRQRIEDVIEELRGTCKSLHEVMTDEEQDDQQLLEAIDDEIFCCATCGWWCELSEAYEPENVPTGLTEPICLGCAEPDEDA